MHIWLKYSNIYLVPQLAPLSNGQITPNMFYAQMLSNATMVKPAQVGMHSLKVLHDQKGRS